MKKADRILDHEEFAEIRKEGKRFKSPNLLLHYRSNDSKARVGIGVSKKNGNAVTRNLIKRQIRAAIDRHLEPGTPIDLIVTARYEYQTQAGAAIEGELAADLEAIGAKRID